MSKEQIVIEGVTKTYPGGTRALNDINLVCEAASITAILGPSGCGKTTLLRCVAGLERVTSGWIHIGDRDVTDLEPRDRAIGMVFQDDGLYPDKTAYRNIEFPLRMLKAPRAQRNERVRNVAATLQISSLLERKPRQMSGGQRQRVGIGRAIAPEPAVLLMDEPLSALDAALRTDMRAEIHRIQRLLGMTVLYVTHDQIEAMSLGDNVVVMSNGEIQQVGPAVEVFDKPANTFVAGFLGNMNLVDVVVGEDGTLSMADTKEPTATGTNLDPGRRLKLGMRPGDVSFSAVEEGARFRCHIDFVETVGTGELIHVSLIDGSAFTIGTQTRTGVKEGPSDFYAPRASLHLFDESGTRIDSWKGNGHVE